MTCDVPYFDACLRAVAVANEVQGWRRGKEFANAVGRLIIQVNQAPAGRQTMDHLGRFFVGGVLLFSVSAGTIHHQGLMSETLVSVSPVMQAAYRPDEPTERDWVYRYTGKRAMTVVASCHVAGFSGNGVLGELP